MSTHVTQSQKKRAYDATALAILAVLFVAFTIVTTLLIRGARLDLTDNKLYSIAPGTKRVLSSLEEPINLYFFFSQEPSRDIPTLRPYAQRVREMLEEMVQRSNGKLRLSVIDPQPFSEDEDRAAQFGLQAVPVGARQQQLYFGLAGTNSTDGKQNIGFFQPEKEEFLEYDIASLIYKLAHPKRPTVGILSSLPIDASFDQQTGQMKEGWAVVSQLRELYTVRSLTPDLTAIDKDIDVLMLVHPKNLAPTALYAIDQFVMRGGKLLAFVDPHSELDPAGNPMAMSQGGGGGVSSDLNPLFKAWGIDYDSTKVVGDQGLALTVALRQGQPPSRHLGVLALPRQNMNDKDVVTANLDVINVMTAGALKKAKDAKTEFEPLLYSSKQSALMPADRFTMLMDPQTLLEGFTSSNESYVLAARVHGKLASAYPDGAPKSPVPNAAPTGSETKSEHLKEATADTSVIVIADVDMLADMMWLRQQNLFGQRYAVAWANNGDFMSNVIDNLAGSADLISVRGRQSFFRPFKKVDELRLAADQQLRAKEQELNRELQEAERKLTALQSSRADQGSLSLTKEQEAEVLRFQQERSRIRKELRDVRRSLDVGIENLGSVLKGINIALIPLVLIVIAIAVAVKRRHRLEVSRAKSAQRIAA